MPEQLGKALSSALGIRPVAVPGRETVKEDEFLSFDDLVAVTHDAAERSRKRHLAEVEELSREARWEDVVSIFHPVEEKQPELVEEGLDTELRSRVAFALGQLKRFDEAIRELLVCVNKEPGSFLYHGSLAFTAYNSLFSANNREIFLRGQARTERIGLAHAHFRKARELRPDGVTAFYREGMLYRKIERKTEKALPLFETAVSNWDRMGRKEKEARHQERKNFIKALYQRAGCMLEMERPEKALADIRRCLNEDEKSNHVSPVFKYFALGKIQYNLNRFGEAKDALVFALDRASGENDDFVRELLARTYLAQGQAEKALEIIRRIPEKLRRPYVRWTEADILCALKRMEQAKAVLRKAGERDTRSRHKSLVRLTKIEYSTGNFSAAMKCAEAADRFFRDKWGNPFYEGMFWAAVSAYRLGDAEKARETACELQAHRPNYPKLDVLLKRLG